MDQTAQAYEHLIARFVPWAQGREDIRAAVVIGSRATQGPEHDTWMRGRFLEEWADPRAVMELRRAFARYDTDEIWRALAATMDLFRWLSVETAGRWGFAYPTFGAERATKLVHKLLAGKA